MKSQLLLLLTFLYSTSIFSQTNAGWSQYGKPLYVNQMVKDASGNYHYATNLGYQKLDGNFNTTEFINLTSHQTPLGNCFAVAVNPSNENQIALAENKRLFIYTNGVETNLIEVSSATTFTGPSLYYNKSNTLYIFDKFSNTEGYSIFENGTLTDVVTTGIKPRDIIENKDGTKIFIAGANNGLWEYTKATDSWVNYTMGNSNLMSNFINDMFVDDNDDLYLGTYQGITKLEPNGTMTTCEPPTFYPVFELDINPISGEILARTSQPNSANTFGISIVDFDTCTWTNYTDTNSSLNVNMFQTAQFAVAPENGKIVVSEATLSAENTFLFDLANPQSALIKKPIEFIANGVPTRVGSNYTIDLEVREKTNGTLDVGFTNGNDTFYYLNIDPSAFNGNFPAATTVTLPNGRSALSIIKDNENFIVENNEGFAIVDGNDNITELNHNIPDYLPIVTKKAAKFNSDDGIITLIHKGFDASFNYIVYRTVINTVLKTIIGASVELFTNNRDKAQNILLGASEDKTTGDVVVVAVKTNSSGEIARTAIQAEPNLPPVTIVDGPQMYIPVFEPIIISFVLNDLISMFVPDNNTINIIKENSIDNNIQETNISEALNNYDVKIMKPASTDLSDMQGNDKKVTIVPVVSLGMNETTNDNVAFKEVKVSEGASEITGSTTELGQTQIYNPPSDIFIKEFNLVQYSNTEAMIVLLTNYGILIKTAIDISNLILSTDEVSLKEAKLLLYPNPATDVVAFSNSNISTIEIYDIAGKFITSAKGNTISVKPLSKGIYLIKGTSNEGWNTIKRLIKN